MRIALAQINPTLGDFSGNLEKITTEIQRAQAKNCDLVVFPEAALFGYHPFDLLERSDAVKEQNKFLKKLQKLIPKGITLLVGCFSINPSKKGRPFFNSAVLLRYKAKPLFFNKTLLPTGDVFDEARFIESGDVSKNIFKLGSSRVLVTICEDIWAWENSKGQSIYRINPLEKIKSKDVDLVLNLSASPFYLGKQKEREAVVKATALHFKAPVVYVNMVGAQDEIIFDGSSFVMDAKGKTILKSLSFAEDLNVIDFNKLEGGFRQTQMTEIESLRQALVLGIRDYCGKTGLQRVHLGLSGGIDSAVVAALAVEALGPNRVTAIAMPGPYNAEESFELAKLLAKNLGIHFDSLSITAAFELLKSTVNHKYSLGEKIDLVHENLQARIRGIFLMAHSNVANSMLLSTSNKSEIATGYSTLYGDMCGGLAPIGDLLKNQVYALARLYNSEDEVIPIRIIERPPTAELKPGQKDQDSLPEYDLLDKMVSGFVVDAKPIKTEKEQWLFEKITRNEFKRWQSPPILKVSKHSFGRGRRWPVAHKVKL